MALQRWERFGFERPERLRRWFDFGLAISDGVLHISAKREEKSEHRGRHGLRSEFRYGEFSRSFPLPNGVEADSVKAQYKDGILEIRIPWTGEEADSSTKRVPISRS